MNYTTVFDVARDGFVEWTFPAFGLIFVAIGAGMVLYRRRQPGARGTGWKRLFHLFYLTFAIIWTLGSFAATYGDYSYLRDALATGQYILVEGPVTGFKPAPVEGHADEEFDVGGHHYSFSDYVVTAGYHKSHSHGGVFREGLRVRIADVDGQIARLEIVAGQGHQAAP